jgi:hypothetical protein
MSANYLSSKSNLIRTSQPSSPRATSNRIASVGAQAARGVPDYPLFPIENVNRIINSTQTSVQNHLQNAIKALSGTTTQQVTSVARVGAEQYDPIVEAQKAMNFNAVNMELFKNMATDFNNRQINDRMTAIRAIAPEFDEMRGRQASVINSFLAGEVGAGTQAEIARSAAFKNLQGGTSGSQAGRGISARDLGLASAGLQVAGLGAAEDWVNTAANILPMPISGAQIMANNGMKVSDAIQAASDNARLRQSTNEFNANAVNQSNQFNASQVNQFSNAMAIARSNVFTEAANTAAAFGATRIGASEAWYNSQIGRMNQAEKRNTILWESNAAAAGTRL